MRLFILAWLIAFVATEVLAADSEFFPYGVQWDDASLGVVNLSDWNEKPAGKFGFVKARGDGHFYAGDTRIRFFGVNVVFKGAMPEHEEADKIAGRLSKLGFNIVRFHHMDTLVSPNGLLKADARTLDPVQLDKLDYFISALKHEGIYIDLNLHVGRVYPGFSFWRDLAGNRLPESWKGVDVFYPPMIALQKEYANDLLTHYNPYLGKRYVDEPAVAIVEVNNESGLIYSWRRGDLDLMGEPYRSELQRQWNLWLAIRYKDDAGLHRAWEAKGFSLGAEMLNAKSEGDRVVRDWRLQTIGEAKAALLKDADGSEHLKVLHAGSERWHVQVHQQSLSFKADQPYTLRVRLRADRPQSVRLMAVQNHEPFRSLWEQKLKLDLEWREFQFVFSSPIDEPLARLTLGDLGAELREIWIADSSLRLGGQLWQSEKDLLARGIVPTFTSSDFGSHPLSAQRDWLNFLWDVEAQYWSGMNSYLKDKLGVSSLVVGSQVNNSPALIQKSMDILDAHAYWDHPRFPAEPWSRANWRIENKPMAGVDGAGTIARLGLMRLPGKPFIVTEYNHAAPNEFASESLPLIAAYAAMHDWDGVFVFSYGTHNRSWKKGYVDNFFDINANPNKLASMVVAATLFRRGDVSPVQGVLPGVPLSRGEYVNALRVTNKNHLPSGDAFGVSRNSAVQEATSLTGPTGIDPVLPVRALTGELIWGVDKKQTVSIDTPLNKGLVGAGLGRSFDASGVRLQLLGSNTGSGVIFATILEGASFAGPARLLITALGNSENTGQTWVNKAHTSLGSNWGQAPVLIESIKSRITLPVPASRVRAWALNEAGQRNFPVVVLGKESAVIETGPQYKSLWYEVEISRGQAH